MIIRSLYSLFIRFLGLGMQMASYFNPKAKKWVAGRNNWQHELKVKLREKINSGNQIVWMHASSLGEFEQGMPVIKRLKGAYPKLNVVVSFFSPSGYEAVVHNKEVDLIFYLPLDTKSNANDLVSLIKPDLVLWIKYEYWWNILDKIRVSNIPILLISAIFQERQPFFKWYGKGYVEMLQCFTHLFVQTSFSKTLIKNLVNPERITVSGDTRFDRVVEIAAKWQSVKIIEDWIGNSKMVIVAGSTWHDDEKVLKHYIEQHQEIKWIIVPHKIDNWSIKETKNIFNKKLIYSELLNNTEAKNCNLLIIDTIGLLSKIYKYGGICFIGGGFSDTGIHNTLEAAVYSKPLIFGPEYEEYDEAVELIKKGAAFSIANVLELEARLENLLNNKAEYNKAANAAKDFVYSNAGASTKILNYIHKNRLLINK